MMRFCNSSVRPWIGAILLCSTWLACYAYLDGREYAASGRLQEGREGASSLDYRPSDFIVDLGRETAQADEHKAKRQIGENAVRQKRHAPHKSASSSSMSSFKKCSIDKVPSTTPCPATPLSCSTTPAPAIPSLAVPCVIPTPQQPTSHPSITPPAYQHNQEGMSLHIGNAVTELQNLLNQFRTTYNNLRDNFSTGPPNAGYQTASIMQSAPTLIQTLMENPDQIVHIPDILQSSVPAEQMSDSMENLRGSLKKIFEMMQEADSEDCQEEDSCEDENSHRGCKKKKYRRIHENLDGWRSKKSRKNRRHHSGRENQSCGGRSTNNHPNTVILTIPSATLSTTTPPRSTSATPPATPTITHTAPSSQPQYSTSMQLQSSLWAQPQYLTQPQPLPDVQSLPQQQLISQQQPSVLSQQQFSRQTQLSPQRQPLVHLQSSPWPHSQYVTQPEPQPYTELLSFQQQVPQLSQSPFGSPSQSLPQLQQLSKPQSQILVHPLLLEQSAPQQQMAPQPLQPVLQSQSLPQSSTPSPQQQPLALLQPQLFSTSSQQYYSGFPSTQSYSQTYLTSYDTSLASPNPPSPSLQTTSYTVPLPQFTSALAQTETPASVKTSIVQPCSCQTQTQPQPCSYQGPAQSQPCSCQAQAQSQTCSCQVQTQPHPCNYQTSAQPLSSTSAFQPCSCQPTVHTTAPTHPPVSPPTGQDCVHQQQHKQLKINWPVGGKSKFSKLRHCRHITKRSYGSDCQSYAGKSIDASNSNGLHVLQINVPLTSESVPTNVRPLTPPCSTPTTLPFNYPDGYASQSSAAYRLSPQQHAAQYSQHGFVTVPSSNIIAQANVPSALQHPKISQMTILPSNAVSQNSFSRVSQIASGNHLQQNQYPYPQISNVNSPASSQVNSAFSGQSQDPLDQLGSNPNTADGAAIEVSTHINFNSGGSDLPSNNPNLRITWPHNQGQSSVLNNQTPNQVPIELYNCNTTNKVQGSYLPSSAYPNQNTQHRDENSAQKSLAALNPYHQGPWLSNNAHSSQTVEHAAKVLSQNVSPLPDFHYQAQYAHNSLPTPNSHYKISHSQNASPNPHYQVPYPLNNAYPNVEHAFHDSTQSSSPYPQHQYPKHRVKDSTRNSLTAPHHYYQVLYPSNNGHSNRNVEHTDTTQKVLSSFHLHHQAPHPQNVSPIRKPHYQEPHVPNNAYLRQNVEHAVEDSAEDVSFSPNQDLQAAHTQNASPASHPQYQVQHSPNNDHPHPNVEHTVEDVTQGVLPSSNPHQKAPHSQNASPGPHPEHRVPHSPNNDHPHPSFEHAVEDATQGNSPSANPHQKTLHTTNISPAPHPEHRVPHSPNNNHPNPNIKQAVEDAAQSVSPSPNPHQETPHTENQGQNTVLSIEDQNKELKHAGPFDVSSDDNIHTSTPSHHANSIQSSTQTLSPLSDETIALLKSHSSSNLNRPSPLGRLANTARKIEETAVSDALSLFSHGSEDSESPLERLGKTTRSFTRTVSDASSVFTTHSKDDESSLEKDENADASTPFTPDSENNESSLQRLRHRAGSLMEVISDGSSILMPHSEHGASPLGRIGNAVGSIEGALSDLSSVLSHDPQDNETPLQRLGNTAGSLLGTITDASLSFTDESSEPEDGESRLERLGNRAGSVIGAISDAASLFRHSPPNKESPSEAKDQLEAKQQHPHKHAASPTPHSSNSESPLGHLASIAEALSDATLLLSPTTSDSESPLKRLENAAEVIIDALSGFSSTPSTPPSGPPKPTSNSTSRQPQNALPTEERKSPLDIIADSVNRAAELLNSRTQRRQQHQANNQPTPLDNDTSLKLLSSTTSDLAHSVNSAASGLASRVEQNTHSLLSALTNPSQNTESPTSSIANSLTSMCNSAASVANTFSSTVSKLASQNQQSLQNRLPNPLAHITALQNQHNVQNIQNRLPNPLAHITALQNQHNVQNLHNRLLNPSAHIIALQNQHNIQNLQNRLLNPAARITSLQNQHNVPNFLRHPLAPILAVHNQPTLHNLMATPSAPDAGSPNFAIYRPSSQPNLQSNSVISLTLPRDQVIGAVNGGTILPGDIVTIALNEQLTLVGKVVDSTNPISFTLVHNNNYVPAQLQGNQIWNIPSSECKDLNLQSLLQALRQRC